MALLTPVYLEPTTGSQTYQASDLRGMFAALVPVPGVFGTNDLLVAQRGAGANPSVDVAAGSVAIAGTSGTLGTFYCPSTSTVNIATIGGFPASGHTRTDAIVAQVFDDQSDGSSLLSWTPVWVQNGSLDTGVVPTLPRNSQLLASVSVIGGHTSIVNADIHDARGWAVGIGSDDTQKGTFTIAFSSGSASGTVTFPRPFAGTPTVVLSCNAITGNTPTTVNLGTPSATGFSYRAWPSTFTGAFTGNVAGAYIASF